VSIKLFFVVAFKEETEARKMPCQEGDPDRVLTRVLIQIRRVLVHLKKLFILQLA
jgi:hypothetical protein